MAIQTIDNFSIKTGSPIDDRLVKSTVEEALTTIPKDQRYVGLPIVVLNAEGSQKIYWFKNGIEDSDFVEFNTQAANSFDPSKLELKCRQALEPTSLLNPSTGPFKATTGTIVSAYGHVWVFDGEKRPEPQSQKVVCIHTSIDSTGVVSFDTTFFAPDETLNVIRIIDPDGKDVCYIVGTSSRDDSVLLYPNGTCQTVLFPNKVTPQKAQNVRLLTSLDGNKHSWLMYNETDHSTSHTYDPIVCLQLETGKISMITPSTPDCSIGSNDPLNGEDHFEFQPYQELQYPFEAGPNVPDPEFNRPFEPDWLYADNHDGNPENCDMAPVSYPSKYPQGSIGRFKHKAGAWQSIAGSTLKNKYNDFYVNFHNGVYELTKGAILISNQPNREDRTYPQYMIVTPEGFIGWFNIGNLGHSHTVREIDIQMGPYAGKRGIIIMATHSYKLPYRPDGFHLIVNTNTGNPEDTVVSFVSFDPAVNLNCRSGKNVFGQTVYMAPTNVLVLGSRVFLKESIHEEEMENTPKQYLPYIDLMEISPVKGDRKFDAHVMYLPAESGLPDSKFTTDRWRIMIRSELPNPPGTFLFPAVLTNSSKACVIFVPDAVDDYNKGVKPQVIGGVETSFLNNHTDQLGDIFDDYPALQDNRRIRWWHNRLFISSATHEQIISFTWKNDTKKWEYSKINTIPFTEQGRRPTIVDDKLLLYVDWSKDSPGGKVISLIWDENNQDVVIGSDGNQSNWNWPSDLNDVRMRHVVEYRHKPTPTEYNNGIRTKIFFFCFGDTSYTASLYGVQFTYTESPNGDINPKWEKFPLDPAFGVAAILPTPIANKLLILTSKKNNILFDINTKECDVLPDQIMIRGIHDITNLDNPDESPFGAYLLYADDLKKFYILEWDYVTNRPRFQQKTIKGSVSAGGWNRGYALPTPHPDGALFKGGRTIFGLGLGIPQNQNSTSAIIVDRVGGTINHDGIPDHAFTSFRLFARPESPDNELVLTNEFPFQDTQYRSNFWLEPRLTARGTVRFHNNFNTFCNNPLPKKRNVDARFLQTCVGLLGVKVQGNRLVPEYGFILPWFTTNKQDDLPGHQRGTDSNQMIEVGATSHEDTIFCFDDATGARLIKENYAIHDKPFATYDFCTFAPGPKADVFIETENIHYTHIWYDAQQIRVINEIHQHTLDTLHIQKGQRFVEATFSADGDNFGNSTPSFYPIFVHGHVLGFTKKIIMNNHDSPNHRCCVYEIIKSQSDVPQAINQWDTLIPTTKFQQQEGEYSSLALFDHQPIEGIYMRRDNERGCTQPLFGSSGIGSPFMFILPSFIGLKPSRDDPTPIESDPALVYPAWVKAPLLFLPASRRGLGGSSLEWFAFVKNTLLVLLTKTGKIWTFAIDHTDPVLYTIQEQAAIIVRTQKKILSIPYNDHDGEITGDLTEIEKPFDKTVLIKTTYGSSEYGILRTNATFDVYYGNDKLLQLLYDDQLVSSCVI